MIKQLAERQSFEIGTRDKKVSISNQELISHGCKNCVWRLNHQCKTGINKEGYCMEYVNFILSFAEGHESISSVWEKFSLYTSRIESSEDYKEYKKACEKVRLAEKDKLDYKELSKFRLEKEMLRLWWERLNDTVMKGYSRIAEREAKSRDASKAMPGIANAKVVNFNIKEIEHKDA